MAEYSASTQTAIDPVCGMTVNPASARGGSFEHRGTTYYFCSPGCRAKFSAAPDEFLKLKISDEKTINFFALVPIYREEMDYKLKKGVERLAERLENHGITELIDVRRRNVCKKKPKTE